MILLRTIESWEIFRLKLHTYRVILQPLCRHSALNASALCLNLDTNYMEMIPVKTRVRRLRNVPRET